MTNNEAIDLLDNLIGMVEDNHDSDYDTALQMGIEALKALRWISCSEQLPEDDTLMLVNYIDHRPDAMDIWIGWHEMENVWYIDGEQHSRECGNDVIAWMPLPAPYQKDGDQND